MHRADCSSTGNPAGVVLAKIRPTSRTRLGAGPTIDIRYRLLDDPRMTGHAFVSAQIELDAKLYPGMNEQHSLISRQFFRSAADRPYARHDVRVWESSTEREPRLRDESGRLLLGDALLGWGLETA